MNKLIQILIISFTVILSGSPLDSLKSSETGRFIILPFGFYTNETSVALGIFSAYDFSERDKIFGNMMYTFKNQMMLFLITDTHKGNTIIQSTFKLKNYYSEFYGIGNDTEPEDRIKYSFFSIDNYLDIGRPIIKDWELFLGMNNFFYEHDDKFEYMNGAGIKLKYSDVTEKFFRDGILFTGSFLYYPEFTGNYDQFSVFETELGLFRSFNMSSLNILLSSIVTQGEVHFEKLSSVGGTKILRGYPERRFVDMNMLAAQAEYDVRIYKNISAAIFAGTGDVYESISDISAKYLKFGYGGGLMYKYKGIILRFEIASSPENDIMIIATGNRAF